MIGALLSLATMAVAGRELAVELSPFQILLFRNVVGLAVLAVILGCTGWRRARTAYPGLHLKRNLLHFLGGCGWFYGLSHLPLAQAGKSLYAAGATADYQYSDAMKNSGVVWTRDKLAAYIEAPKKVVSDTRMIFWGISDPEKIDNILAYLETFQPK